MPRYQGGTPVQPEDIIGYMREAYAYLGPLRDAAEQSDKEADTADEYLGWLIMHRVEEGLDVDPLDWKLGQAYTFPFAQALEHASSSDLQARIQAYYLRALSITIGRPVLRALQGHIVYAIDDEGAGFDVVLKQPSDAYPRIPLREIKGPVHKVNVAEGKLLLGNPTVHYIVPLFDRSIRLGIV